METLLKTIDKEIKTASEAVSRAGTLADKILMQRLKKFLVNQKNLLIPYTFDLDDAHKLTERPL